MLLFPHDDTRPETLRQVYQATRTLLDTPARWVQDSWADDRLGMICNALSPVATCYCLGGGLLRVLGVDPFSLQSIGEHAIPASPLTVACLLQLADQIDATGYGTWRDYQTTLPWSEALDHITSWNDESDRTHAEVLALLDVAIATLPTGDAP